MSLLTLDVQLPKNATGNLPQLLNGSASDVISWNLLYSDPQSSYFRIELLGHARAIDVESRILEGCPQARVKIKDDSAAPEALLLTTPRSLDFRRAFHRTSPEFIEDASSAVTSRAEGRKLTGISNRALLLSDGNLFQVRQRALLGMERDAYLICKFTDHEALPLLLETRNEEEFIRNALAVAGNAAVIRLSMLQRHQAGAVVERMQEQLECPVIHAEHVETAAILAAMVRNAANFHKTELAGKNIGIVGLSPSMCGLAELLRRMGAAKTYGIDTDYSAASRFEKEGGIATSLDFALDRCDFIVIGPQTPVLIDGKRLNESQIVLSFTQQTLDGKPGESALERFHYCQEPHPIYAAPGLMASVFRYGISRVGSEVSQRLAEVLIERCGENRFLPLPSETLIQAQVQALAPLGSR
jgi:hypothetical protein